MPLDNHLPTTPAISTGRPEGRAPGAADGLGTAPGFIHAGDGTYSELP
jgi:hypothetical protein